MRPSPLHSHYPLHTRVRWGLRRHRAVLPHQGNHSEAIEFGCLKADWRLNSTMMIKMLIRIGRGSDCLSCRNDARVRQAKTAHGNNTKAVGEVIVADTQNWGKKKLRLCGPRGRPRGQAVSTQQQNRNR
jgi:hypothetical protein